MAPARVCVLLLAALSAVGWAAPPQSPGAAEAAEQAAFDIVVPEAAMEAVSAAGGGGSSAVWNFEAAVGHDQWRKWSFADEVPESARGRLSAQFRGRWPLSQTWSAVYAHRLDIGYRLNSGPIDSDNVVSTPAEAYVSRTDSAWFVDVGRFNERVGVAYGYNPTDFFRHYAVVARVSEDPTLLRSTRLGVVGVRVQHIADNTSWVAIYAPPLRTRATDGVFSPHLERTNSDSQWLLRISRRLSEQSLVEAMAYHREGTGWQPGVNLSMLLGERTVLYGEWSMTREADVAARADAVDSDAPYSAPRLRGSYRSRAAIGTSVAIGQRVQAVLEAHYDGTGLDGAARRRLASPHDLPSLLRYLRLRDYVVGSQSLLSRRYLFGRLSVRKPFGENSSLSTFVRYNLEDRSRYLWLQVARNQGARSYALTIAAPLGDRATEYGDVPARATVLLTMEWAL